MIKRAQGRKRFGMKNFKKRWFRLTNHEFTYQKSKGNKALTHLHSEAQEPWQGSSDFWGMVSWEVCLSLSTQRKLPVAKELREQPW
jgi:hypothetical protein